MQQLKLATKQKLVINFVIFDYNLHIERERDSRTTFQIFSVKLAAITRRNIRIAKTLQLPLSPHSITSWPTDWLIMTNPVEKHTHKYTYIHIHTHSHMFIGGAVKIERKKNSHVDEYFPHSLSTWLLPKAALAWLWL